MGVFRQYFKRWLKKDSKTCHLEEEFIRKKFSSRRLTTPYYLANLTLRLKTVRTLLRRCCSPMRTRRRLQTVDANISFWPFWAHFWTLSLSSESHVYTVHTRILQLFSSPIK